MTPKNAAEITEDELRRIEARWKSDVDLKLDELTRMFYDLKNDLSLWREKFSNVPAKIEHIEKQQHAEDLMHAQIRGGIRVLIWMVPVANALAVLFVYYLHKAGLL